ncbi:GNAT family N-acetyltransferase [Iamia sp.]|uniref:GNAT family N-acetyltransferase n=1 Tax=Iamia sp. TaxID=2722710 RepID=UPI002B7228EF|nr:GNAT family N-acetyltransferase [Iamia sp.]HXH58341.1 GNAT family N-acetyltransferase [Iamia sp.]
MESDIRRLESHVREGLVAFIGDSPETVLAIHALQSGLGRVWTSGPSDDLRAVIVESALVPGEPQGFGDPASLLDLLARAEGWRCIELNPDVADDITDDFERRWGIASRVIDVVHISRQCPRVEGHPRVRPLRVPDLSRLSVASDDVFPGRRVVEGAAARGRVFVAIDGDSIVGHGSSFAASGTYADIGVYVAASHRGQGIATSAAALACEAVRADGLTPVWGTGSDNQGSLGVAAKLGFLEVARLVFLVPVGR